MTVVMRISIAAPSVKDYFARVKPKLDSAPKYGNGGSDSYAKIEREWYPDEKLDQESEFAGALNSLSFQLSFTKRPVEKDPMFLASFADLTMQVDCGNSDSGSTGQNDRKYLVVEYATRRSFSANSAPEVHWLPITCSAVAEFAKDDGKFLSLRDFPGSYFLIENNSSDQDFRLSFVELRTPTNRRFDLTHFQTPEDETRFSWYFGRVPSDEKWSY